MLVETRKVMDLALNPRCRIEPKADRVLKPGAITLFVNQLPSRIFGRHIVHQQPELLGNGGSKGAGDLMVFLWQM